MIEIQRKEDCCGCGACYDVCSKKAIIWQTDDEGFSYPYVDTSKCVNCGLCNKVCPVENSDAINSSNANRQPTVCATYHKNEEIRFTSTSGGAFWGLAEPWIDSGGYVAGAVFNEQFKVRHIVTNNKDGLSKIKGSKYAQSDCRGMYRRIAELLKQGERVMATGLPCQMAGLKQYLRKDYENLLLVNTICHSVSSPRAFEKYIDYLERKYKSKMINYHPKNKEYGGWHNFAFVADFENGKRYVAHFADDLYTQIFVGPTHLLTRSSCFECHFKIFPQPTDITIGDCWGIETFDPSFDSPKGVSIMFLNTEKGKKYFDSLDCFEVKEYDIHTAVYNNKRNASIRKSVARPDEDTKVRLIADMGKMSFEKWANKYFMPHQSIKSRIRNFLSKCIRRK